jgi:hypothetical protein
MSRGRRILRHESSVMIFTEEGFSWYGVQQDAFASGLKIGLFSLRSFQVIERDMAHP